MGSAGRLPNTHAAGNGGRPPKVKLDAALNEALAEAGAWLAEHPFSEVTITKKAGVLNLLKSVTRRMETEE